MRILVTGARGFVGARIMDAAAGAIAAPSRGCAVRIAVETRGSVRSWGLSPIWFSLK